MASISPVFTPDSPEPIGPYSQAIKVNGFIFLSAIGHIDPSTSKVIEGSVTDKATRLCKSAKAVLEAAGSTLDKAVKVTVYFRDLDDFQEFNQVYGEYFTKKPARSVMEVQKLPMGMTLAMDLVAVE